MTVDKQEVMSLLVCPLVSTDSCWTAQHYVAKRQDKTLTANGRIVQAKQMSVGIWLVNFIADFIFFYVVQKKDTCELKADSLNQAINLFNSSAKLAILTLESVGICCVLDEHLVVSGGNAKKKNVLPETASFWKWDGCHLVQTCHQEKIFGTL